MQIGGIYIPFTWLVGGLALLMILVGVIGGGSRASTDRKMLGRALSALRSRLAASHDSK